MDSAPCESAILAIVILTLCHTGSFNIKAYMRVFLENNSTNSMIARKPYPTWPVAGPESRANVAALPTLPPAACASTPA